MSLSDSQVRSFTATEKRQKQSCGDSLFLVVEPINKGGGKSFMGRLRFPPGRKSPDVDSLLLEVIQSVDALNLTSSDAIKTGNTDLVSCSEN